MAFHHRQTFQERLKQHEYQLYPLIGSCLELKEDHPKGLYQENPLDLSTSKQRTTKEKSVVVDLQTSLKCVSSSLSSSLESVQKVKTTDSSGLSLDRNNLRVRQNPTRQKGKVSTKYLSPKVNVKEFHQQAVRYLNRQKNRNAYYRSVKNITTKYRPIKPKIKTGSSEAHAPNPSRLENNQSKISIDLSTDCKNVQTVVSPQLYSSIIDEASEQPLVIDTFYCSSDSPNGESLSQNQSSINQVDGAISSTVSYVIVPTSPLTVQQNKPTAQRSTNHSILKEQRFQTSTSRQNIQTFVPDKARAENQQSQVNKLSMTSSISGASHSEQQDDANLQMRGYGKSHPCKESCPGHGVSLNQQNSDEIVITKVEMLSDQTSTLPRNDNVYQESSSQNSRKVKMDVNQQYYRSPPKEVARNLPVGNSMGLHPNCNNCKACKRIFAKLGIATNPS